MFSHKPFNPVLCAEQLEALRAHGRVHHHGNNGYGITAHRIGQPVAQPEPVKLLHERKITHLQQNHDKALTALKRSMHAADDRPCRDLARALTITSRTLKLITIELELDLLQQAH